jgi:hypothetical protein
MNGSTRTARRILQRICVVGAERLLALALVILFTGVSVFSQANLGRIAGSIIDQTGGAMAGATVTVTDTQRGVARVLTTDDAGAYNAPNLTPGTYTVKAEAKGFKTIQRENILIEVGKEIRVDLTLQPGEQQQTITVTELIPMVETTNATLGGTLSNATITELPLNGRNFVNLLSLRPGMQVYLGGGTYTRSSNGTRADDIGYLIDGLSADEGYTGQSVLNAPIAAGDASSSLPIDAIQEFNTEQNPKAEFGWKPGSIVNAGLKSGTNTLHGSAFAFGRTDALDARNFFNPAKSTACDAVPTQCNAAPHALEQFGASLGGTIKKDKLFYFVNYEGQRYTAGQVLAASAPVTCAGGTAGCLLAAPDTTNSIIDACNAAIASHIATPADPTTPGVSPLSALISGITFSASTPGSCTIRPPNYTPGPTESFFPTNNGALASNNVVLNLQSVNQQDNGVAKIDYHINDQNQLTGMYFRGQGGGTWADSASEVGIPGTTGSPWQSLLFGYIQMGSGAWTFTPNSTVVNELRAGYTHFRQPYLSVDNTVNPIDYGINTGITDPRFFGFPRLNIQGFGIGFGGNWPKIRGPNGSLQFLDHVSILHGNHSFKFGGEIVQNTATGFITSNGKARFRFKNLTEFIEGILRTSGGQTTVEAGDPTRHYSNGQYAAFFQDDWRVTPRLTLNLGLRYELISVVKERDGLEGNFDPNSSTGVVQVGYGLTAPFNGDHNNFSPRFGLAWDVRGNGKTVVRAGGSLMYEALPIATFSDIANALGLSLEPTAATKIYCSTVACGAGSTQIVQAGVGSSGVSQVVVSGASGLTAGWQAQTEACLFTTNCGTVIPSSVIAVQCGDGKTPAVTAPGQPAKDPSPCNIGAAQRTLRTPYIITWTLNLQQAITNNLSLQAAYVGTHGTKLIGFTDINQPSLSAGGFSQSARPYYSKFPFLGEIAQLGNIDFSNYHALQITATERASHGLSFVAGYTWAHALGEASSNWNSLNVPPDSTNPRFMYGNSAFDIRHRFTLSVSYDIPGLKTPGQLLEGWSINSIISLQSGQPWAPQDTSNDFAGDGQTSSLASYGQTWNFFGDPLDFRSSPNAIPFFLTGTPKASDPLGPTDPAFAINNTACKAQAAVSLLQSFGCYQKGSSVLVPPALGTVGNAGPGLFRDSGFRNWDFSVTKIWKIRERLSTQFRAEFFNILNHPTFANPSGPAAPGWNDPSAPANFGCGCGTPDQVSPNPVLGTGGNRSVQLGLKILW